LFSVKMGIRFELPKMTFSRLFQWKVSKCLLELNEL